MTKYYFIDDIEQIKKENDFLKKKNHILEQALLQSKTIKDKFNQSIKLLKQKDKELEALNILLEEKVNIKTKELEDEKNYIQHILDINPDIIIVTNGSKLIKANRSFFEIFGYSSIEEFLEKNDCVCDYFLTLNNNIFPINKMIDGKIWAEYLVEHSNMNNVVKIKVNSSIYFFTVIATKLNQIETLVIFTNITDLKMQEEQLNKSEKMASMGEMIGNIAHQWRQPLSIISTSATGMLMQKEYGLLSDEQFENGCETINRNAQYLSQTIEDFRNFIKGERIRIHFNLQENIESFMKLVEGFIKSNYLQVIINIDSNITLNSYPNDLNQCLINIFNNAKDVLKELPEEDRFIFIDATQENEQIIIKMKDSGKGIPEEILPHIFEPYFTTKHQSQGTGLGLYMTYNLVTDGFGGTIDATNEKYQYEERDYEGACFTISIPSQ